MRKKLENPQPADGVVEVSAQPDKSPRSKWPVRLLYLAILVLFLPSLVTLSGGMHSVLAFAQPRLARLTQFDSVTLHWWSPVEVHGLVIRQASTDAEVTATASAGSADEPVCLLKADAIVTRQPLWRLALNFGRNTEIAVQRPQLNLVVHDGRTNLEDTLADVFGETDSESAEAFPVSVTLEDGVVTLRSGDDSSVATTVSGINGHISTSGSPSVLPDVSLVASLGIAASAEFSSDRLTTDSRRAGVNPRIAATLDDLAADFTLQPFEPHVEDAATEVQQPSISLRITPASGDSDAGLIAVEASRLPLADLQPLIRRVLPGSDAAGDVSCRLQVKLLGNAVASGLAGRLQVAGRDIRWRDAAWAPGESLDVGHCSLNGAVAIADDGILVNDLRLQSSVVELSGSGEVRTSTTDPLLKIMKSSDQSNAVMSVAAVSAAEAASAGEVTLHGRIDIAALASMLPQTMHLRPGISINEGAVRFAAKLNREPGSANVGRPDNTQPIRWHAAVETTPVQAVDNGRRLSWKSPLRADLAGHISPSSLALTRSRLTASFGTLNVDRVAQGLRVTGTLNPDRLWQDVSQLLDVPRPGITTDVDVAATLTTEKTGFRLTNVLLQSNDLQVSSPKLVVSSNLPLVDMLAGSLHVEGTGAALQTVVAPWYAASWLSPESRVTADLVAEPDQLLRLQANVRPPAAAFRNASVHRTISSAVAASSGIVVDQATVDLQLAVDPSGEAFRIHDGLVEVPGLKCVANGSATTRGGILHTDMVVDVHYDLDTLCRVLLQDPEQAIHFTGQGHDQFRIQGAPSLLTTSQVAAGRRANSGAAAVSRLSAAGSFTWTSGQCYGLSLGPGTARVTLDNGLLRAEPIHCSVNSGQLDAIPLYDLNTQQLQLATGSRVENIDLTPELARQWVGYATPLLSDTAQVSGRFSVRVDRFMYAINRPATSSVQAVLTVQHARAVPGSSMTPLLQLAELVQSNGSYAREISMPPQTIALEMRNGMVSHDAAVFELAGYQIRSSGGVGVDERIRMTLQVPTERSTGQGATVRTIAVPVTGTLGQPRIDTAGLLQNVGTQRVQEEINGTLDRELNKLFDKLR